MAPRSRPLLLASAGCALLLASCGAGPARREAGPAAAAIPPRPAACRAIAPGAPLAAAIDAAAAGDSLCLEPGRHPGPLRVSKAVHVWGPREAVIASSGSGTTVHLSAPGSRLEGVTVDGSGGRVDLLDAAVKVEADDVVVRGVRVRHSPFGILAHQANRVVIEGCDVLGDVTQPLGMRGDGIRLWEVRDSRVEGNHVEASRDVVVWYSSRNRLARNTVVNGRYGTHFMYSHDNVVEDSRFEGNIVGTFIMYSRGVTLRRNDLFDSGGAAGMGLGIKESGNIVATQNRFVHNTTGLYLDTSPLQADDTNLFEGNSFRLGQTGVVFHGSERRNTFRGNDFRDNRAQARVEGGTDALGVTFTGNHFDDYQGFDLDDDGTGDLPYELRSLSGGLVGAHPELAFFEGTASLALVDAVGKALPLFAPKTLLRDEAPRVAPLGDGRPDAD